MIFLKTKSIILNCNKMKKLLLYIPLISIILLFINCSEMNDVQDEYLKNGEIIYIPSADSIEAFSGENRVLLRMYTRNPMISTFAIFWDQGSDSLIVPVENRLSPDYFDVQIGENSKILTDKSYIFEIYSRDSNGHRSIKTEKIAQVYGDRYISTLENHYYQSAQFEPSLSSLTMYWYSLIDDTEIGVEFTYQDKLTNLPVSKIIGVKDIGSSSSITDIDSDYPVLYRTMFLPEPTAIDTFYTDFVSVELIQILNVVLNKPVKTSDDVLSTYVGENAVDGIISNDSRWVTNDTGVHWLEIDLGQEYNIYYFQTLMGSGGTIGWPISTFNLQAEVNGEWKDIVSVTGNSNAQYGTEFDAIATSKVRYYIPDYVNNRPRLYEISVLAKVKI